MADSQCFSVFQDWPCPTLSVRARPARYHSAGFGILHAAARIPTPFLFPRWRLWHETLIVSARRIVSSLSFQIFP